MVAFPSVCEDLCSQIQRFPGVTITHWGRNTLTGIYTVVVTDHNLDCDTVVRTSDPTTALCAMLVNLIEEYGEPTCT